MIDEAAIRLRWDTVGSQLDERGRRLFAAAEVRSAGRGGLALVSKISGLARSTINRGEDDLDAEPLAKGRVRRAGGGRRAVAEIDPGLVPALKRLVEPATLGDPMRPLIWVSKSMEKLAAALTEMGHPISADTVRTELVKLGFSRQSNRKANEGSSHPDRNAQFDHINAKVVAAQAQRQPVISVDTKKKELIGNFKNGGTDYRPKGDPQRVNVHDFEDKKLGKVVPYGVYDVTANAGLVSVGITSDTAEFAVASIRCWLERMGRQRYPQARELTITADCGGSNGARLRLWKVELQKLANETGLVIHVHHYPPGTSKWNKIEHRLFCHITQNWRGRPLTDRLAVVELIGATTTKTGLKVESVLDTRTYQKGIKVTNAAMKRLDITGDQFHPEWNYTIKPGHPDNRSTYCSVAPKPASTAKEAPRTSEPTLDWAKVPGSARDKLEALQRRIQRQQEQEYAERVRIGTQQLLEDTVLPNWRKLLADASAVVKSRKGIFTKAEFEAIRKVLHHDSRLSASPEAYNRAFELFNGRKLVLVAEKDHPVSAPLASPKTYAERMALKEKVKAEAAETRKRNAAARAKAAKEADDATDA